MAVIVDPMHGSAAGGLPALLGHPAAAAPEAAVATPAIAAEAPDRPEASDILEIRSNRDPLFGGHPPEPLEPYLGELIAAVRASTAAGRPALGIVFDGDGDRIAAIDEQGRYCSTQLLMPLLIDHLARARGLPGAVVKTVSGSDLMQQVAEGLGRRVIEKPVGFKYIAAEMLSGDVLIGGEESGGVGLGMHLPERDALFVALLVVEAVVEGGCLWASGSISCARPMAAPAPTTASTCGCGTWPPASGWNASWPMPLPPTWRARRCWR